MSTTSTTPLSDSDVVLMFDDSEASDLNLIKPNGNQVTYNKLLTTALVEDTDYYVTIQARDDENNLG